MSARDGLSGLLVICLIAGGLYACVAQNDAAHAWCDPRGYEVYSDRAGVHCRDPETGLTYQPPRW